MEPRPPQFGEEDGRLSYGSYLKIDELLSLQNELADPPAHDEMLFIINHQVYELWFKVLLYELEAVRDLLLEGEAPRARHLLSRIHRVEQVIIEQIPVLESMSPQDFLGFRTNLAPASGFQSAQFREIEYISGLKERGYLNRLSTDAEQLARLERRLAEPSLWDAFCTLMEKAGLSMPDNDVNARRASLVRMAHERDEFGDLFFVSEDLLTHDELFALWRYRHVLMVERQIGAKTGTGGSTGASYLRSTLDKRFFPELWELRSFL